MAKRIFCKKTLAVVLSLAMLMSCMVFSFGANAEVVKMWENDFEDGSDTNWAAAYKGKSDRGDFNSGLYGLSGYQQNYAALQTEGDNTFMAMGFGNYGSRDYLSGFWMYHGDATNTGTGYGSVGSYTGTSYAGGNFMPKAGKYYIEIDYNLANIQLGDGSNPGIDICVGFHNALWWSSNKKLSDFGDDYVTLFTVTKGDLDKGWQSKKAYFEVPEDGKRLHIFAKVADTHSGSMTGSEVWLDNVVVTKYDSELDLPADPAKVGTLIAENDFTGGSNDNWYYYYHHIDGVHSTNWHTNFHSDATKSVHGNYADVDLNNGYMKLGFNTENAEDRISAFIFVHQSVTQNTTPGVYGYSATSSVNAKYGNFSLANGNKYAIQFDYKVESFNDASASSVNLYVGHSDIMLDGEKTMFGASLGVFKPGSTARQAKLVTTVGASDKSAGWQTAVASLDTTDSKSLFFAAEIANNTSANLTNAVVLIDNIKVYQVDEAKLPSITFMYNGNSVGSAKGIPGEAFVMPTLSVSAPEGTSAVYYADENCSQEVSLPNTFANISQTFYVGFAKEAMWENHFDNGTSTNWKANYAGKSDDGAANSGQVGVGTRDNYAVLESDGSNSYMTLGFGNAASTGCLSGFWMFDEDATHTTAGEAGYAGDGYRPSNAVNYTKGNFRPTAGQYIVKISYKVAKFVNNANAAMDICVGLGAKDAFFWDGDKLRSNMAKYATLVTVDQTDVSDEWQTAVVALEVPQNELSLHIFATTAASGTGASLTESEVYIDNVQIFDYDIAVDQTTSDRTAYLYNGTTAQGATNLHKYVGNTEKEGVYTSIRLGAKYTAGDSTGKTIVLDGVEYELVERGIVAGNAGATLNADGAKGTDYLWKSSKTTNFDQYWEPNPVVPSDDPTQITFTLRLANMSEAWFTDSTEYQFRSYYKVKTADFDSDNAVFTIYGPTSDTFTFDYLAGTFEKSYWFDDIAS